eukprot:gene7135-241_t
MNSCLPMSRRSSMLLPADVKLTKGDEAAAPEEGEAAAPAEGEEAPALAEGEEAAADGEKDPAAFVFGGGDGEEKMLHDPPASDTPPGRIITGEELCASLERMTNAYVDKYEDQGHDGPSHIATGVTSSGKTMTNDDIEAMIARLYTTKEGEGAGGEFKLERVTLKFDEAGKERWEPVKQVSGDEQKEYMTSLYDRCIESKKKTKEDLAAKYLKPLGQPRKFT